MRIILALGGALVLAGCAGYSERVTLLTPAQEQKREAGEVGAIAVLNEDGSDEVVIDTVNQQAELREGTSRVRQLGADDPLHREVMGDLPREENAASINFATGQSELTPDQIDGLRQWIAADAEAGPRPGSEILVRAYADSFGPEDTNLQLSVDRARAVVAQLRAAGLDIEEDAFVGMGEFAAQRDTGDEVRSEKWRRVDIIIR